MGNLSASFHNRHVITEFQSNKRGGNAEVLQTENEILVSFGSFNQMLYAVQSTFSVTNTIGTGKKRCVCQRHTKKGQQGPTLGFHDRKRQLTILQCECHQESIAVLVRFDIQEWNNHGTTLMLVLVPTCTFASSPDKLIHPSVYIITGVN